MNNKVGSKENSKTTTTGKYFPKTIPRIGSGCVNNHCKVPELSSSDRVRMVNAGIKNKSTQGAMKKKLLKVAVPILKMLNSLSKNHKNKVQITTKAEPQMYAMYPVK